MNDAAARKAHEAAVYNKEIHQDRRTFGSYFDPECYVRMLSIEYEPDFERLAKTYLHDAKVLVIGASRQDVDRLWRYTQDITAIDISKKMIDDLTKRYPDVKGIVGDAEKLKDVDGRYDVVFAKAILHHLHPLDKVLQGVASVLSDGGVLFVAGEPGTYHPIAWLGRKLMPSAEHTDGEKAFDFSVYERTLSRNFVVQTRAYYYLLSLGLAVLPAFVPLLKKVCMKLLPVSIRFERNLLDKLGLWRMGWLTMGVYKVRSNVKS